MRLFWLHSDFRIFYGKVFFSGFIYFMAGRPLKIDGAGFVIKT